MTDPKRWSDAGGSATPLEQLLVTAGQDVPMPGDEKQAVWQRIAGTLPLGATLRAPTASTATLQTPASEAAALSPPLAAAGVAGATWLFALKGTKTLCFLAAVSGLVAGGYHWFKRSPAPSPEKSSPALVAAPATPNVLVTPQPVPLATDAETSAPHAATVQPLAVSRASQLREESLAVMAARQALRANDPLKALRLLEQAQQRFRKGALTEEREALSIEALAKAGQSARASTRAQAFLTHYPRSPHAADIQRFVTK